MNSISFQDFQYILSAIISIVLLYIIIHRLLLFIPGLMKSILIKVLNNSMIYSNSWLSPKLQFNSLGKKTMIDREEKEDVN